jgi:hypothetical protein
MLITSRRDPFCMGPVEVPIICNLCHYKLWLDSIVIMYTILSSFLSFQFVLLVINFFSLLVSLVLCFDEFLWSLWEACNGCEPLQIRPRTKWM